jgi:predicted DNA-binding WGR domain protein
MKRLVLENHRASEVSQTVECIMNTGLLKLTATNRASNLARFYTIRIDRNLWNHITVSTSYGRIGTHGNIKHAYFEEDKDAQIYLKSVLRKRLNSEKRIGVDYRIT